MLPGRLAGSGAARVALFALVAVVIGAGLWLVGDDGASPATTRLEATQTSVDPLLGYAPTTPWDTAASAPLTPAPTPGPAVAPGTESVPAEAGGAPASTGGSPAPSPMGWPAAVGGRADSVEGGVDGGAGSASGETTPARGTGAATSSADTSGAASGPASAPSAGAGAGAGDSSPSTAEPTPTTQAPTTTAAPAPAPAPRSSGGLSRHTAAEAEVVPLTNDDRAAAGLGSLSRSSCLDSVASGYAEQMARSGVLAHNPGAGAAVAGCRTNPTWGDNVGTSKPCDTARLEREWMDSPSHRRNILTGAFTLIGVGAWTDEKGACWVQVLFSS